MSRAAILWCVGLGLLLGGGAAAQAQGLSEPLMEDEVNTYVGLISEHLLQCNAEWFERQFSPGAKVRFIYANRQRETFTPPQYINHMRRSCNPLEYQGRQVVSTLITDAVGGAKRVQWTNWWGQREGATVRGLSTALLTLDNETVLVKHRDVIQIEDIRVRVRELVPGSEARWRGGRRPFDVARDQVQGGMAALNRWNEQLQQWIAGALRKPAPKPEQDDGWN